MYTLQHANVYRGISSDCNVGKYLKGCMKTIDHFKKV